MGKPLNRVVSIVEELVTFSLNISLSSCAIKIYQYDYALVYLIKPYPPK